MKRILICWIGNADLKASEGNGVGVGPIAQALDAREFDEVFFITDYKKTRIEPYIDWIRERIPTTDRRLFYEQLSSPMNFGEIYEIAASVCEKAQCLYGDQTELTFHLSPGTPAMASVWIILAKTRFPAELIESSIEHGVQTASVPFDISAKYLPTLLQKPDAQLRALSEEKPPESANFGDVIYRSQVMARVVEKLRRVAVRNVTVLLEGESGTGKELFARAIHQHSPRKNEPFKAVNCGAIPPTLIETLLFGQIKGAFTDAGDDRKGLFEEANHGTLFLDEIGELPKDMQVKILRVLQEKEVVPVGPSAPTIEVDVRIVAATNRNLIEEVGAGRFREDLFYRLAVAYLKLPPVRDREGDLGLLIDHSLKLINEESEAQPGYKHKKISPGARNLILKQRWPGNVRELQNTLRRAMVWSEEETLTEQDIEEAILPPFGQREEGILDRSLGGNFSLEDPISSPIGKVTRHYLNRALKESKTKKEAAELLGFRNAQTFTNWANKYHMDIG